MRAWYARSNATSLLNRMLAFDFKYTLTDNDLPKVVTACRLAGVEVAFPFLDDAVIAFAERLDPGLKLKGFKLRWFFKHALRDFLPPEILTKSKHGFGLPFGIWLGRDPALRQLAFDSLESLKTRGIVRDAFIDRLRADLLAEHATYYGELVWVLMMLEQWLQAHA
jgi:asparagine synthase (glutamine-hydrolysing)